MKKLCLITSIIAMTSVIGTANAATTFTDSAGDTVDISGLAIEDVTNLRSTLNGILTTLNTTVTPQVNANAAKIADHDTAINTLTADMAGKLDATTAASTYLSQTDAASTYAKAVDLTALENRLLSDYYTLAEINNGFVKKETGKGLSTNDYSDADKAKVDALGSMSTKDAGDYYTKAEADAAFDAAGSAATVQNDIETKLGAGASGYDINAKSLKIGGKDVATEEYVDDATTIATAGTSSAGIASGDSVLDAVGKLDGALKAAEDNIGDMNFTGSNVGSAGSLTDAVNALDAVLGDDSDYASTINGVSASNSVKANINAINETLGDISTMNAGNAITNGTGTAPTTIVGAINNIDATLGQIHGLKMGNSNLQADSNLANGTTVEQHLVALDDAIGNRNAYTNEYNIKAGESIATSLDSIDNAIGDRNSYTAEYNISNGESVAVSLDRIDNAIGDRSSVASLNAAINSAVASDISYAFETTGNLIGDMDFSSTAFLAGSTNLSDALRTLDSNVGRIERKLDTVEHNLKSGLAAMSALSALVPNARDCGNTQISVGTGAYADRFGVAVGGFHYFNDHVLFNAGASYGGTRDWAFRAGVTFGL